ncbi:phosphatidylinositol 4-kinase [Ordospora colligata]|nr:phosphatidylinositol 4-kinase [Ordospora colligata]
MPVNSKDAFDNTSLPFTCTDIGLALSYMHKATSIGVQHYICNRIRYCKPPIHLLPQLMHVFLNVSSDEISWPMSKLLRFWASRSNEFACALYFHLRCALEQNNTKSVFCYFMICDLLDNNRINTCRNISVLELQYKHTKRLNRTVCIPKAQKEYPRLKGMFLFFAKVVSWFIDPRLFKKLHEYEDTFIQVKHAFNINPIKDLSSGHAFNRSRLESSIMFIQSLAEIPDRLMKLPRYLRKRGLEMEIRLLNHNLPARVFLPIDATRHALTARIEESFLLDSAESSPFLVVFETSEQITRPCGGLESNKDIQFLKQQLDAVDRLSSLGEINVVRENVLISIERILMTERQEKTLCSSTHITDTEHIKQNGKPSNSGTSLHQYRQLDASHTDQEYLNADIKLAKPLAGRGIFMMEKRSYSAEHLSQDVQGYGQDAQVVCSNLVDDLQSSRNDPSIYKYHSSWMLKTAELKRTSQFIHAKGWRAQSVIIKTGESLKQELLAYQVLLEMKQIWKQENVPLWIHGYQIYLVSSRCGIIETVVDAMSIHKIKQKMMLDGKNYSLKSHFMESFGQNGERYKDCVRNFLCSLVGYSLATYILQVKDRHNGNIMIDREGHVVHVDFGFIMGGHPGFYCVEGAPFKFSKEYLELLDGLMDEFKELFLQGYLALRRHSHRLFRMVEMLFDGASPECFNPRELANFKDRFQLSLDDAGVAEHVEYLIGKSFNNMGTGLYDSYQYFSYGYL